MARAANTERVDHFKQFYRQSYSDEIGDLASKYPGEKRSLYIDWADLYQYNADLAEDYLTRPEQLQEYAEEALRLYDLPVDVSLGQAHVRITGLPETVTPSDLQSQHVNALVAVEGVVVEASDVDPQIQDAAFECQRCGTLTYIPQTGGFQEPHECQGCERQGPFQINFDQSEFIDVQELVLHDIPGATDAAPTELTVHLEDDITGTVRTYERVVIVGVTHLEQKGPGQDSTRFNIYLESSSVTSQGEAEWDQWEEYLASPRSAAAPATDALATFITQSRQILDEGPTLDEFGTQTKIITPFLHVLGWNVYAPEVRVEYPREDDTIDDRADYVLFRDGDPAVVVEAKRAGRPLQPGIQQTKRYMRLIGTDWGLATNGDRYVVLRSDSDSEEPVEHTVLDVELEELLAHRDQLATVARTPPADIEQWQSTPAGDDDALDPAKRVDFEVTRRHREKVRDLVESREADEDVMLHDDLVTVCMDEFNVDEPAAEELIDQSTQYASIYQIEDGYRGIGEE